MNLRQQIKQLEKVKKEGNNKVMSMYLNTDPSDLEQHFRKGIILFATAGS
ncbi:hypothetical protein [Virgibacillus doumboii]|nr:hypothetical protein [Virgibacillus doumboii]